MVIDILPMFRHGDVQLIQLSHSTDFTRVHQLQKGSLLIIEGKVEISLSTQPVRKI